MAPAREQEAPRSPARGGEEADELNGSAAPTEVGASQIERLLADLNSPQREAVTHGEGPLLILAGAGSGKTRALTHRIAWLLATGRARPNEILAITFTNKAAEEMRDRVATLVGGVERRMWVMTFHAACARILRAEGERLGYTSRFTIYDEADSLRMMKRVLEDLDVDAKRYPPRAIRARVSDAKNGLIDAETYQEEGGGSAFEELVGQAYRLYERRMLDANAMDFDDLLTRTVNVLELYEDVRRRYRERFRWVLVDEYQDTNHAQYRLLQLLCGEHGNLTVVGDEDQSIYGFRQADIRNILEFEKDFPESEVVKLEQNYRSTKTILAAANEVVSNNRGRLGKHLWTDLDQGERIVVAELDDEHAEARFVAGEIESLVGAGVSQDEIAVFYRTNAQSRVLEDILVRYELPYQVIGGTKFYERAEIKDAVAYLQLILNPADEMSFSRIVNSPRRGIGNTSQARLLSHANTSGETIWEVARTAETVSGMGAAAIKSVGRFVELIEELRAAFEGRPVAELLEALLERSGYLDALRAERTIEAEGRIENLDELVGVAAEFDANRAVEGESELSPLEEFLQAISLYTDQDELRRGESRVTLMTLHNAKGLEYEAVFMIGCEEGVFPHMRALEEGEEEEERRLCYVGITRAKSRLWLTHARSRRMFANREIGIASRFLSELPDELVEREGTEEEALTGWTSGAGAGPGPARHAEVPIFATGDDVVHASFGEGVVTAVEPGGVIVVRFAGDGAERKLMADYAPLRKAA